MMLRFSHSSTQVLVQKLVEINILFIIYQQNQK